MKGQRVVVLRGSKGGLCRKGSKGKVGAWNDADACWQVDIDGVGIVHIPASDLQLDSKADAPLHKRAVKGDDESKWLGRQAVEEPCVGDIVEACHDGAWVDAMISECVGRRVRVVIMSDCLEVVLPKSRIRRKENIQVHKGRLRACEVARKKLQKATVTTEDVLDVLRAWKFVENPMRTNVFPEGKTWVYSDTIGLISSRYSSNCVESTLAKLYPDIIRLLSRWLQDSGPSQYNVPFPFTSVNINFDYAGRLHRDKRNVGPSLLRALGDFSGGKLLYYPEDDRSLPLDALPAKGNVVLDAAKDFQLFDGNRAHAVEPFAGERFSLVFFTCGGYHKVATSIKNRLVQIGVQWPTTKSMTYFNRLLKRPKGYRKGKRKASASEVEAKHNAERDERPPAKRCKVSAALADTRVVPAEAQQDKCYRVQGWPHLDMHLELGRTYKVSQLVRKCKGDLDKVRALRKKLHDPKTFQPVS